MLKSVDVYRTYRKDSNFVNMMVDMLASNDWCNGVGFLGTSFGTSALKLQTLLFETSLYGFRVTVLVLTVLDRDHAVYVLLRQHLSVLDRLNRSVVMVLVHLSVDGGLSLLMTVCADFLIHNSRSYLFMDGGVMMTRLRPKDSCQLRSLVQPMLRYKLDWCRQDDWYPSSCVRLHCGKKGRLA